MISFHDLAFEGSIPQAIMSTHQITIITNENISIAVTNILLSDHISIGKAFRAFTLVVLPADSSLLISIQSHMKGTTVFNCIPQHFWVESQMHFVWSAFAIVQDQQGWQE